VIYRALYDTVLRHLPPEEAHKAGFGLIRAAARAPGGTRALRRAFARPAAPAAGVRALGLDFPGPLGLAAGFDKDGVGVLGLAALGFGFVEVGTVTARPQPGNAAPRMFRFPDERALVNRMGFNNAGAAALARRLRVLRATTSPGEVPIIGVNIGKTKAVPEEAAIADYVTSAQLVADVADYVVVNVSSPNTPGLRDLQSYDKLHPLLRAVRAALDEASPRRRVPLLVKIAPDLADADIDTVADLALGMNLDGIIATNTTTARAGLHDAAAVAAAGPGGLSGPPLKARSLEVLKRIHARTGDYLTLISAGGIETPEDARARLNAGATLLQAYTAFIYEGPAWPRRIQQALASPEIAHAPIPVIPALGLAADLAGSPSRASVIWSQPLADASRPLGQRGTSGP
jgi:dihydroorotate dehydrogenase